MNENQLKMIVPPTVGILVAGLASGICYLLLGSLRKGKGGKTVDDSRCACCLKPFLVGRGVECNDCGARSCRKACCRWDSVENSWFCLFCYHSRSWAKRREKWFRSFGGVPIEPETSKNFSTAKCRVYDEGAEHVAIHSELDMAAGGRKEGDSMETVREFVERIVEGLVGNVDDTPIDRLYDHQAYDRLLESYGSILASALTRLAMSLRRCMDNKPATETPTMAHTALRELVERAVDEARKLPCLGATVSTGLQDDTNFSEQNYEDLLATAILNKVIEKFQNERVDGNSNILHRRPRSKYTSHDNEIGLDEGVEEGSSSLEPVSQDECSSEGSGSRTRQIRVRKEPMSLTIEEQIEEITTTYTSDEELRCPKNNVLDFRNARRVPFPEFGMDIVDPSQDSSEESQDDVNDLTHVDMITPVETWEENWLFQRRKIQTQSEPVAMLVPNPSADFRALIGDKDADDTSDLSEFSAQSDDEIEDDELIEAINQTMPKSSVVDTNFSTSEDKLRANGKIVETPLNVPSIRKKENNNVVNDPEEFDVNREFEIVFRQNINEKSKIYDTLGSSRDKRENGDSGLSENSYDPGKYSMKYPEIPKTPAPSPSPRDSLSENTPEVSSGCDFRQLNDKLVVIDKIIDEEEIQKSISDKEVSSMSYDRRSREDTERDRVFSSNDVNEDLKSSPMNGCAEAVSQGPLEVDNSNKRSERIVQEESKSSSKKEIKSNGDVRIIEKSEPIANGRSSKESDSQCQTPMEVKAASALTKPGLRNVIDDEIELSTPPRPGTIAEREHKKWENAAPIENNPYSEENIQKRLLERQYSRRSSDVSGSSNQLQTSPSPPLQIVLGAGRPDFKRFGRDYYINEAKFPNGRSITETGFFTATSRPNSSLSQNSVSTGSEGEHQERSHSVETESTSSASSEPKTKMTADLRRNNVESALRRGSMPVDRGYDTREILAQESPNIQRRQSMNDPSQKSYEDILERQRKNNKNEINARLNNRGNFEDNSKRIKRIDLRAYGFANEFNDKSSENELETRRSKPVINKLDLRRFGYDSGLRRTQSNNNIDSRAKINIALRSRTNGRNVEGKSNLIEQVERRFSGSTSDEILSQSTESLNTRTTEDSDKFERIKSAKSVPNIGELYSRLNETIEKRDGNNVDPRNEESNSIETEERETEEFSSQNRDEASEINATGDIDIKEKSQLPSVRRLARTFSKTEEMASVAARKASKIANQSSKDRPSTLEIQIVDTPRQMHSLTARSLSREFREGLRQINSKPTTPPTAKIFPEQSSQLPERPTTTKDIGTGKYPSVLAPGKLKNNIQFWEKMNRKS